MAIDAYLQIADIKGESTDENHKGWIEVTHVDWSVNQPRATSVSTAGGHTNGRADLSEVTFSKLADLSSPILFQHCAMGKTIPRAVFEFYRADGQGKPICYFKLELENVMISNVHPNSGNGGTLSETVHLAYARIKATRSRRSPAALAVTLPEAGTRPQTRSMASGRPPCLIRLYTWAT